MPLRGIYPLIQSLNEISQQMSLLVTLKASGLSILYAHQPLVYVMRVQTHPLSCITICWVMWASLEIIHC